MGFITAGERKESVRRRLFEDVNRGAGAAHAETARRPAASPAKRPAGAAAASRAPAQAGRAPTHVTSAPRPGAERVRQRAAGRAVLGGRGRSVAGAAAVFLPPRLTSSWGAVARPGPRGRAVGKPAEAPRPTSRSLSGAAPAPAPAPWAPARGNGGGPCALRLRPAGGRESGGVLMKD